jgi:hypothetical protein
MSNASSPNDSSMMQHQWRCENEVERGAGAAVAGESDLAWPRHHFPH